MSLTSLRKHLTLVDAIDKKAKRGGGIYVIGRRTCWRYAFGASSVPSPATASYHILHSANSWYNRWLIREMHRTQSDPRSHWFREQTCTHFHLSSPVFGSGASAAFLFLGLCCKPNLGFLDDALFPVKCSCQGKFQQRLLHTFTNTVFSDTWIFAILVRIK